MLGERRPDDAILGEEGGATGDGELRWIVDPLDGTVNFLFGIPQFSVSVACQDGEGMVVGVVLDPVRGETFAGTRSGPPTLNGEKISGPCARDLATALVSTGFAYDAGVRAKQALVMGGCCPAYVTSAAPARPRWTSPGWPAGATTPTTSAASICGTTPPAA